MRVWVAEISLCSASATLNLVATSNREEEQSVLVGVETHAWDVDRRVEARSAQASRCLMGLLINLSNALGCSEYEFIAGHADDKANELLRSA